MGLIFIGLLGALVEAKYKGLVPSVRQALDELKVTAGFWMTEELSGRVLQAAGE
ncbi:MAG: DUF3368 domain-containing protein [Pyrinomonadaceae bacterium]